MLLVESDGESYKQQATVGTLRTVSTDGSSSVGIFSTHSKLHVAVANLVARQLLECWSDQHGGVPLCEQSPKTSRSEVIPSIVILTGVHFGRIRTDGSVRKLTLNYQELFASGDRKPQWQSSIIDSIPDAAPSITFQDPLAAACVHFLSILGALAQLLLTVFHQ